jgi:hypothetical protein
VAVVLAIQQIQVVQPVQAVLEVELLLMVAVV